MVISLTNPPERFFMTCRTAFSEEEFLASGRAKN
jgi:hypothetical protein